MSDEPAFEVQKVLFDGQWLAGLTSRSAISTYHSYYRQPGGCIEASDQDEEVDILHFCTIADARTFLAEFGAFVDACEQADRTSSS